MIFQYFIISPESWWTLPGEPARWTRRTNFTKQTYQVNLTGQIWLLCHILPLCMSNNQFSCLVLDENSFVPHIQGWQVSSLSSPNIHSGICLVEFTQHLASSPNWPGELDLPVEMPEYYIWIINIQGKYINTVLCVMLFSVCETVNDECICILHIFIPQLPTVMLWGLVYLSVSPNWTNLELVGTWASSQQHYRKPPARHRNDL